MTIAMVRYNGGNVVSIQNALRRLGAEPLITDDPHAIAAAERVIFPGVGEASSAMNSLRASGLDRLLPHLEQPFLGICLGLQLLCRRSEESATCGLGVFDADIERFPEDQRTPHMGWNTVEFDDLPLFAGVDSDTYMYFAHSYRADVGETTVARTEHGPPFSAALARDNFWGVQFHPEKSGAGGARILQNFLELS